MLIFPLWPVREHTKGFLISHSSFNSMKWNQWMDEMKWNLQWNEIISEWRKRSVDSFQEGETTMTHQSIFDAALVDLSHRHLLLIFHKGHLVRALALCPPSSSSFTFGSILVSRVNKKDATSGSISVLVSSLSPSILCTCSSYQTYERVGERERVILSGVGLR